MRAALSVYPCVLTSKMDMTMKKIFAITLSLVALVTVFSCSKKDFDDRYYDPSKTTTVSCAKLMTGAFYTACDTYKGFGYNTYWRLYTWEGFFSQVNQQRGFNNDSGSMYFLQDGWANDRWENFYKLLAQYRLLEKTYEDESELDQQADIIYKNLTEVFLYDHLSQVCDAFGPVPFSKAGYLGLTSDLASSYPAYDSDEELYGMMIDRLGTLYQDIEKYNANISGAMKNQLKNYDFINCGDLDKWARYANSLRLRLATHVAAKGSLTTKAAAAIKECAGRKQVDSMEKGIFGKVDSQDVGDGRFYGWYKEGFAGDGKNATASQAMIDAMKVTGKDDPRLKVIYNPNGKGEYVGKHVDESSADQAKYDAITKWEDRHYATLDSVTFISNGLMENPVFTPAENWFLLAEAYQQNYASGNAKDAFVKAVSLSIAEWYQRNMNASDAGNYGFQTHFKATSAPTTTEAEAYANAVWDKYSNKLEAIMTQKWLHLGIMGAHESFTDIRRTGFPKLTYPTDKQAQRNPNIIQRVLYPLVEKNNNTANYEAATASFKDDNSTVLFWAKELK